MPEETNKLATLTPEPKRAPYPKELSPEYHKAHKQLMLWSAILFIWDLSASIWIRPKRLEATLARSSAQLRAPRQCPWALLILVASFLFKTNVEWHQCSKGRRELQASKVDFASAWIISFLALALYIYQATSRIQVADRITGILGQKDGKIGFSGFLFGLSVGAVIYTLRFYVARRSYGTFVVMSILFFLPSVGLAIYGRHSFSWRFWLVFVPLGIFIHFLSGSPYEIPADLPPKKKQLPKK